MRPLVPFLLCLLTAATARAELKHPEIPDSSLFTRIAEVGVGVGLRLGVHEIAGHELTALALGEHLHWQGTNWTYAGHSKRNLQLIAGSGFTAEALGGEGLMATVRHDQPILVGYVADDILESVVYSARAQFQHGGYQDLGNYNQRQRNVLCGVLLGRSAGTLFRMARPDALPLFFEATSGEFKVGLQINW